MGCIYFEPLSTNKLELQLLRPKPTLPSNLGKWKTPIASLQRGKTLPNKCSGYDTKHSDGEVAVKLEL